MSTFKERLQFLWGDAKPGRIASEIEMSRVGFDRLWKEGGMPKAETLLKIKAIKKCSIDWLLTGEGEPYPVPRLTEDSLPEKQVFPMEPVGIGKRIEMVIDLYSSKKVAANVAGCSVLSLRRYVLEEGPPSFPVIAKLALTKGVSLNWVASGKGVMKEPS